MSRPSARRAAPIDSTPGDAPIRVLHIITRMILGGAQENTLLSVEGLNELDRYEVSLVSGVDHGREGELLTRARETTNVIVVPELGRGINPFADVVAFVKLYRIIRAGGYEIVHTHSSKAGVLGRLAAWLAGVPVIVHTLHSLVFHDYQPWAVNRLWWAIKKLCAPITDHFISVSSVISEKALAAGIGDPERYTTIYSGMELDWFVGQDFDPAGTRRELGIPEQSPVVGKVARLFPLKGHDQLLDAAAAVVRRCPDVRFLLVGDGELDEHLRRRVQDLGISENFVFVGLMPRERVPEMLSAIDVLVHTSLREGLARVLPQALAMGKPCVAFDIDGAREVVITGETGFLVDAGDSAGLTDGICRLLEDEELRHRMGENGKRRVDPAFRSETMVRGITAVYEQLLEPTRYRVRTF